MSVSTRTRSKTKAELKAEEGSKAAAKRQTQKNKKHEPTADEILARSALTAQLAAAPQPRDDKQRRTYGIVARGNFVNDGTGYKGPGMIVTAGAEEIERMRKRGVLVDEGRTAHPLGRERGPLVLQEDAASKGAKEG